MTIFSDHLKNENALSGIDARVKLLVSFVLLAMTLSYKGLMFPLFVTSFCFFLCLGIRIPLRIFLLRFSEPLFLALAVLVLKFLFSGRDVLFSFEIMGVNITGHRDGLIDGLAIGARMIGSVSIVAVLGFTTPFPELMAGLSWLKVPRSFVEILMLAYRYIFVLLEEALVIYNAQKNRLGYSSIRRGLSSFGTLAGSLTLRAFEHSHNTTVAMVQRGYDGNIPTLQHKPLRFSEVIFSILFILALGVVWKI